MRQYWKSPGTGLMRCSVVLMLAVSMWFLFSDGVAYAQSDQNSCEVDPLDVRIPVNQFQTGIVPDIGRASGINRDNVIPYVNIVQNNNLLSCGSNILEPFITPSLEYTQTQGAGLYQFVTKKRYITAFVSCVPETGKSAFPEDPQLNSNGDYTPPWIEFMGAKYKVSEKGVVYRETQAVDTSLEDFALEYSQSNLQNVWTPYLNFFPNVPSTSQSLLYRNKSHATIYSYLVPGEVLAITYSEYELAQEFNQGFPPSDASVAFFKMFTNISLMVATQSLSALPSLALDVAVDSSDGELTTSEAALAVANNPDALEAFGIPTPKVIKAGGGLVSAVTSGASVFSDMKDAYTLARQMTYTPYEYGPSYQQSEYTRDIGTSAIKNKLIALGYDESATSKIAVRWNPDIRLFEIAGSGFMPMYNMDYKIYAPSGESIVQGTLRAYGNQNNQSATAPYEANPYLDYGELYHGILVDSAIPLGSGCYFVAVRSYAYETSEFPIKAGNFVWIDEGAGSGGNTGNGTATPTPAPTPTPVVPQRTCANPIDVLTEHANLFSGINCGGDISWFSGHPENGPGASGQQSLFVPPNTVVNVSSNDNGGGDRTCFATSVIDLNTIGWANRIQWAQKVTGGTCPSPSVGHYIVHTNQGDFRVNQGEVWDNAQYNRQVLGFDKNGDAYLKINHQGGAQRCWDESKSAQELQNDGDWWIQTKSIEIGSGYCPGMNGVVQIFNLANYQGSQNDVRASTTRTYSENDLKYSFKFSQPGMSVKLTNTSGRTRCWNTAVSNLQDHEDYWNKTIKVEAFGTDVCPPAPAVPQPGTFATGSGVKYYYFEQNHWMIPLPATQIPEKVGYVGNFDLAQVPHRLFDYGVVFQTCLAVPTAGTYTFGAVSDDGVHVYVAGQLVVDSKGPHAIEEKIGTISLAAGIHYLNVQYYDVGSQQALGVWWQGPGFAKAWIPNASLSQSGCTIPARAQPENEYIHYSYYESAINSLPISGINPVRTGWTKNYELQRINPRSNDFGVVFQTCVKINVAGNYTFFVESDDGSQVWTDGVKIVENGGFHDVLEKNSMNSYSVGNLALNVNYMQGSFNKVLNVYWSGPGFAKQLIPNSMLVQPTSVSPLACPGTRSVLNLSAFVPGSGVNYRYYEPSYIVSLPVNSGWTPVRTGSISYFNLNEFIRRGDSFAVVYQTCYEVPLGGLYTFSTISDDGSLLYIDGKLVVYNDGPHGAQERSGQISLTQGLHNIEVQYFDGGGSERLNVYWVGPGGGSPVEIPASRLSKTGCLPFNPINTNQYAPGSGINYHYYEQAYGVIPSFPLGPGLTYRRSGAVNQIAVEGSIAPRDDYFSVIFQGCFMVPTAGGYNFFTYSDDGSRLYIDGKLVVYNDGAHGAREWGGWINLTAGLHNIEVQYYEINLDRTLSVSWTEPGRAKEVIPNLRLSKTGCNAFTAIDGNQYFAGSGMRYHYYEHGGMSSLPVSSGWAPLRNGYSTHVNLGDVGHRSDNFAVVYKGCFKVSGSGGTYQFFTDSDDGSRLYIDKQLVVNNDGPHGNVRRGGSIALAPGVHNLEVQYFENGGEQVLRTYWVPPGQTALSEISNWELSWMGCSSVGWVTGASVSDGADEVITQDSQNFIYLPLVQQ